MSNVIKTRPGGEFTCKCGAAYQVIYTSTSVPDSDSADCECCGVTITKWQNETTWPAYELISSPDGSVG